jgi:hypothetical protein
LNSADQPVPAFPNWMDIFSYQKSVAFHNSTNGGISSSMEISGQNQMQLFWVTEPKPEKLIFHNI